MNSILFIKWFCTVGMFVMLFLFRSIYRFNKESGNTKIVDFSDDTYSNDDDDAE